MRIAGWIFLALGTAVILSFAILAIGQGDFSPRLLYVGLTTLMVGQSMRAYARVTPYTADPDAPVVESAASSAPGSAIHSGPTVEMPMTPSAAAVIRVAPRKGLAIFGIVLGSAFAIALVISFIYDRAPADPGSPAPNNTVAVVVSMSLVSFLCLVMWAIGLWLPSHRDLREVTYLRTIGPVELVPLRNGYLLRLADRNLPLNMNLGSVLAKLGMDWAVVDHSKHARVVLGVWDLSGQNVFSAPGYRVAPPRITVRKPATPA